MILEVITIFLLFQNTFKFIIQCWRFIIISVNSISHEVRKSDLCNIIMFVTDFWSYVPCLFYYALIGVDCFW